MLVRKRTRRMKVVVWTKKKKKIMTKIYTLLLCIILGRTRCIDLVIHIQRRLQDSRSIPMDTSYAIFPSSPSMTNLVIFQQIDKNSHDGPQNGANINRTLVRASRKKPPRDVLS
jgi:hypothetical protein